MSGPTSLSEVAGSLEAVYRNTLESLVKSQAVARLFQRDASLWKQEP